MERIFLLSSIVPGRLYVRFNEVSSDSEGMFAGFATKCCKNGRYLSSSQ